MTTIIQPGQQPDGSAAPRVVIAGAGFGGLAAVRRLASVGAQVTLIDRNSSPVTSVPAAHPPGWPGSRCT